MPIIDGHIHLWSHDTAFFPDTGWLTNGESRLPKVDGTAEGLVARMDASGVAWALNVQVPWYVEDNRYHHDVVSRFPGRFSFLAVVDLDRPGAGERFEAMIDEQQAQGCRIHLNEPGRNEKVTRGDHDAVLEVARRRGVTVQFLARNPVTDTPSIERVVRDFDGIKVVIDHLFHPDPAAAPEYAAWDGFLRLGSYPRAYVKVSLQINLSKAPYPHADLHGFTRRVLDSYGPEQCLWGSNYPLIKEEVSYEQVLAIVRDHLPGLTEAERAQVLGGTAASLWSPIG